MDKNLLKSGMRVYIDPRCALTERRHGFSDTMMTMLGTTQKVQGIYPNSVLIGSYNWSPEDLSKIKEIKPVKKHTSVLFNPKELVL